jgi:hypothetical protein
MLSNRVLRAPLLWCIVGCLLLTGLVWLLGERLSGIPFAPDQGGSWYYWKLPQPTVWTHHPMVNTSGHLIGFLYMFLLLVQGSLFFTRSHVNRWWTLTLELSVAVHGTLVAVMSTGPNRLWPMFLFGFLAIFVITQMHGSGYRAVPGPC